MTIKTGENNTMRRDFTEPYAIFDVANMALIAAELSEDLGREHESLAFAVNHTAELVATLRARYYRAFGEKLTAANDDDSVQLRDGPLNAEEFSRALLGDVRAMVEPLEKSERAEVLWRLCKLLEQERC